MSYTSALLAKVARHVQQDDRDGVPANSTQLAFGRKGAELLQYCSSIFGYLDYLQTATEEKVFGFLFYQLNCFRTYVRTLVWYNTTTLT